MRTRLWLAIAGALACPVRMAFSAEPPSVPYTIAELQEKIEAVLNRPGNRTPGAAIAIVRRNGPEWIAGLGFADVTTRRRATADTLFRIGSVSKGFVALSILKLQQEGKLNLQDTLKSRAPDLAFANPWEATDPVRIVHLLEHTAGWDDLALREYAFDPPQEVSLREALDLRPANRTSRWKPGTRYSYCNAGPAAAAYVVEKITGRRFEDYVEENWFRPLGMTSANYFGTPDVRSRLTQLYRADGRTPYPYWKISVRPSGSINASARDMANYVQFYLNRGAFGGVQHLPAAAIDRMEEPTSTYAAREGLKTGYGLNNFGSVRGRWIYRGHGGGVQGGLTDLSYLPECGVGYCLMINSGQGRVLNEIGGLVRSYITRGTIASEPPPIKDVPANVRSEYDGWYEPITPRNELARFLERLAGLTKVTVGKSDLTLRAAKGGRSVWLATSGGRAFRRGNAPVPTLALIADHSEGTLIQFVGGSTLRRLPTGVAEMEIATLVLIGLFALSSIGFAFAWIPRRLWGSFRGDGHTRVRALPLFATLCGIALLVVAAFAVGPGGNVIERLGRVTPWSLALFVLSLGFPLLASWSLVVAIKARNAAMNRLVWWHSFLTSAALMIVVLYLAWWGVVGVRTWA